MDNDTITGGEGNDEAIGGGGTDTYIFSGSFADYTFAVKSGKVTSTDNVGTDGIDTLQSIEEMVFTDGTAEVLNGQVVFTATELEEPIYEVELEYEEVSIVYDVA